MSNYPELGESQFTLFVYGTLASVEEDIIPETMRYLKPIQTL